MLRKITALLPPLGGIDGKGRRTLLFGSSIFALSVVFCGKCDGDLFEREGVETCRVAVRTVPIGTCSPPPRFPPSGRLVPVLDEIVSPVCLFCKCAFRRLTVLCLLA